MIKLKTLLEYPYTRWKVHVKLKTDKGKSFDYKPVMLGKSMPSKKEALLYAKEQWKEEHEKTHGKIKTAKVYVIFNASQVMKKSELKQIIREILDEDLRNWFKKKWVNIGKKDKDGKHPPCGTSGDKRGYAKCVPQATANKMTDKEKESATRRKRAAQNDANRGGKESRGQGKKPINVSTYTKRSGKKSGTGKGS